MSVLRQINKIATQNLEFIFQSKTLNFILKFQTFQKNTAYIHTGTIRKFF